MKTAHVIAAVVVFSLAGTAFAGQAAADIPGHGKTRAQVVAELKQAQADGSATTFGFLGVDSPAATAGSATKAQSANATVGGQSRAEIVGGS